LNFENLGVLEVGRFEIWTFFLSRKFEKMSRKFDILKFRRFENLKFGRFGNGRFEDLTF